MLDEQSKPRAELSFRDWLENEVAHLESIGRTKYGDGALGMARAALKELNKHDDRSSRSLDIKNADESTENQTQALGKIETIRAALIELVDKRQLGALNQLEQDIVDFRRLKEIVSKIFFRDQAL